MAAGVSTTNWKVYEEQFWGGFTEVQEQNIRAFDAASAGAIRIVAARKRGNYEQESFLKKVSALVTRRDITSVSSAADTGLVTDELVRVKINRKIGPVAETLDAWRKIGQDPATMSFLLGQQAAPDIQADYLNSAIRAVRAAITAVTALNFDGTAGVLSFASLIAGLALFGDKATSIVCWLMHSKPFFDLFSDGITNYKIDTVGGFMLVTGTPVSLGRPIVVTDSAALITTGSPNQYHTLGLVADAVTVTESEERVIESDLVTGLENLVMRVQGEYAFNVGVKGAQWDMTAGGVNPTDAALVTSTNWDKVATADKSCAGIRIYSD